MSGHSKWSTIKHKKAANDQVKGDVFTKMAKAITIAVKKGGGVGDPEMNFALRLAVDLARSVNMPKENINRAIERGAGLGGERELTELLIEGFAPGGVAVMATAVTDNSNRTIAELRTLMEKQGGRMGEMGSVGYLFERVGVVNYRGQISDELELKLIDAGMREIEPDTEGGVLYTAPELIHTVVVNLQNQPGVTEVQGELGYKPTTRVATEEPARVLTFLEMLSGHDDVQEVYANLA